MFAFFAKNKTKQKQKQKQIVEIRNFRQVFGSISKEMTYFAYISSVQLISCKIFTKWPIEILWDFTNPNYPQTLRTIPTY